MKKLNIIDLLPQQPPFVMIDTLTHFDEVITRTQMRVNENNIFVVNGELSETGVIENIAQTCAARMGYINKYINSDKIKIGFIGSIKNLIMEELPQVGDMLNTTIEIMSEVFAIALVNAKVEVGNKLIASCEMKISLTDIESQTNE